MTKDYKYRAFISYSHNDEKWVAWLYKALETYPVSKSCGETTTLVDSTFGIEFRCHISAADYMSGHACRFQWLLQVP